MMSMSNLTLLCLLILKICVSYLNFLEIACIFPHYKPCSHMSHVQVTSSDSQDEKQAVHVLPAVTPRGQGILWVASPPACCHPSLDCY